MWKIYMMMVVLILVPLSLFSQLQKRSFEEIDSLQLIENRPVLVFIYTDWCKYCHAMQINTFQDNTIIQTINSDFWFAELNAEDKKAIQFNGHTFRFKPTGNTTGTHELAEQLGTFNGKISYPSICILNKDYEIIFQYDQFLSAFELQKVLTESLKNKE